MLPPSVVPRAKRRTLGLQAFLEVMSFAVELPPRNPPPLLPPVEPPVDGMDGTLGMVGRPPVEPPPPKKSRSLERSKPVPEPVLVPPPEKRLVKRERSKPEPAPRPPEERGKPEARESEPLPLSPERSKVDVRCGIGAAVVTARRRACRIICGCMIASVLNGRLV